MIFRLVGTALLLLVAVPLYSLAGPGTPGSPAAHLRSLASSYYSAFLLGGLGITVVSVLLGLTRLPRRFAGAFGPRANAIMTAPGGRTFAAAVGLVSGLLALFLSDYAFALRPILLDATSQLIHAKYLAAGRLAGPELVLPEFFTFQYMVNLPTGWASQYPPGHIALLALGFAIGSPWIVGPALVAAGVALSARVAEELLPEDVTAARTGAVLLAVSPFFLGHAATYMNHVTAAAFGALAVLGGLRGAEDGKKGYVWLISAGLATGIVFAARPLAGVVIGAVAMTAVLFWNGSEPVLARLRRRFARAAVLAAACIPPVAAVGFYNWRLFGSPTRFGYVVAEGPGHGLGFHQDPWGAMYGPIAGLIQASRDLLALGIDLVSSPLSAVVVVGLYLLLGPRQPRGLGLLLFWALLPMAANLFYWHQDLFMGPRLLTEFTPAWAILTAVAALELVRRTRNVPPLGSKRRLDVHGAVVSALGLAAVLAAMLLIPQRIELYRSQWGRGVRAPIPTVDEPSLVFVHEPWPERLAARLAAHGLRVDSIRAALRHNTSCEVQVFLDAQDASRRAKVSEPVGVFRRHEGARLGAGLRRDDPRQVWSSAIRAGSANAGGQGQADVSSVQTWDGLNFRPGPRADIVERRLQGGVTVRTRPGEKPAPGCLWQANSDRHGVLALPEFLWRSDLPKLTSGGAMFIRDLGPELNARLMELHPDRRPLVYLRPGPGRDPVLMSYEGAMEFLWQAADALQSHKRRTGA